jgi:hypothetical protein
MPGTDGLRLLHHAWLQPNEDGGPAFVIGLDRLRE